MTEQETIELTALQDQLAAKEAECRELRKELHDLRSHAQVLQNKLALAELVLGDRPETTLPDRQNRKSSQS